jgi:glycosyltransferase 2 family protein
MKTKLLVAVKITVSVSLLLYLVSIVDINATLTRLGDISVGFAVGAFFISISMVMLSALKWKIILESDGLDAGYGTLLQSYYIGNFLGLFLPSGFGGDAYRVYALSSPDRRVGKVTSSVLFDRLSGLYALLSIALFGYIALPGSRYDLALVILYASGIAVFFLITSTPAINRLANSDRTLVRHLAALLASFRSYRIDFRHFLKILAIAFLFQLLIIVNNKLYTLALSIDIPFSLLLVIIPMVFLTEVIPLSINGAGVRDSAFVFFFVLIGHTKEEGLAIGLLVIAMRYISGLVGGSVLLASVIRRHLRTGT